MKPLTEIKKEDDIPFPNKRYNIIYADCPWTYNDKLDLQNEGAKNHYPTMSLKDIKELSIRDITDDDCILFMWVTMPLLKEGLEVIESWGFKYKTCAFTWIKTNPKSNTIFKGIGRWVMGNAELCLLATKGKPKRIVKNVSQIVMAKRGKHSVKPEEVRRRIVKLIGNVPRIELFARQRVEGWDSWGNEVPRDEQRSLK